jgi:trimeric autotransporter adhesin
MNPRYIFLSLTCLSVSLLLSGCGGSSSGTGGGGTTTPTPTVTSISPTSVKAGAGDTKLTITGTNFQSNTTVTVGGVADVTSYVSSTQVTATVTASQLASGGQLSVIALNGSVSSGSGAAVNLEVDNPAPTISSVSPAAVTTGAAAQVINVLGTGFVPTTVINISGSARPTAFVSTTQVNVTVSSADVSTTGSLSLTAYNASPGGGTSAASTISVTNPQPGVQITLSPSNITTGGSSPVTVTVTGTNFIPASSVEVNGAARSTTYVSSTQLTFAVTAADQTTSQVLSINVSNPAPGGGLSGSSPLTILTPTPTPVLSGISPTQIVQNSPDTVISVTGTNLAQQLPGSGWVLTSQIQWNNTVLKTSIVYVYNGTETIAATVPASQLTTVGTANITVVSSTSTPATSNALTISVITPPPPTVTGLYPNTGPINTAQTVQINGTDFTSSSTVALNGVIIPSTFVNSTQISVSLPASDVSLPGNLEFTVTTPAPGGGTSSPMAFTAYVSIVNNSLVYNPVNGLAYVTVPSTTGAPYGNTVVSVDPVSGAIGKPIPVGSEPNRIAVSDDGKFLWVGLVGGSAVRRVNLATRAADLQFSIAGNNTGIYESPATVQALAALPGSDTAVVVATSGSGIWGSTFTLAIFDNGVMRTSSINDFTASALQVNGTRNEIYAANSGSYAVYTYSSSGLALKGAVVNNGTYAGSGTDDLQVAGGRVYTDFGAVYDSEAGALLGTFYSDATTKAQGPTAADTTLGRVFILDGSLGSPSAYGYNQIQAFDPNTFNLRAGNTVPIGTINISGTPNTTASHLARWGANGLLFRNGLGVYSLRSNLVKDLSGTSADLAVKLASSGATATGANTTYTATVTNNGPSTATGIALTAALPESGVLVSAASAAGSCSISGAAVTCNLGSLANNATARVTIVVLQTASGNVDASAQVSASENDPVSTNNQSTTTVTVSGAAYNLPPTLASIAPSGLKVGSNDTVITVTGTGFNSGSTVELNGAELATTYVSAGALTATVPSTSVATMGWAPITVVNGSPGGGTSNPLPLTIYKVLTIGVNHILYDPWSRNIMASVGSGSATVTGNSIAPIKPDSGTVGAAVSIGSQPDNLALTSDGNILYTILTGSQSVARFNMHTRQPDFTWQVPDMSANQLRGITTQPGNENTIALDEGSWAGNAIYDFDTVNKTAAIRGQASGPYTGSCIVMPTATDMLAFDTDTSGASLDHYSVTPAGFQYYNYQQYVASTLNRGGCFKADGNRVYTVSGGVSDWTTSPATPLGIFNTINGSFFGYNGNVLPDSSLGRTFYVLDSSGGCCSSSYDELQAFDNTSYMASNSISISFADIEGNTSYSLVDVIRWGQDGVAILTSGGHIYLLRGAAVVPGLLSQNTKATLTSSSAPTLAHGSGNTLLTLTGSNFQPGVAVTWNGTYRTTTIVDSTHVTVAIPASDLSAAGTATLVATNPGASASGALTITIN